MIETENGSLPIEGDNFVILELFVFRKKFYRYEIAICRLDLLKINLTKHLLILKT